MDDGVLVRGDVTAAQWVAALAYFKAAAGMERLHQEHATGRCVVLGADTICVQDGQIIGQPRDADHARAILRQFENATHDVLTGVALIDLNTRDLFVDQARVHVGDLGDERINEYVATDLWRGKAGGYNLQERLEAGWPIRYEGDPTTIVGLPMAMLGQRLVALEGGGA